MVLAAQYAEVVQSLHHPLAVLALALGWSDAASATWTWNPASNSAAASRAARHRLVAQGEGCVQPKSPRSRLSSDSLQCREKRAILLDAQVGDFRAIAIGDLVAEATAQAGLVRGVRNAEQAASDRAGAG